MSPMTDLRGASDAETLKALIDREIADVRTAIPGRIVSFDAATQLATVRPLIRRRVTVGANVENVDMPEIQRVPVVMPHSQTAGFSVTMPVREGDDVMLTFSDRSIDTWVQDGDDQDIPEPVASRHHDISDAIAVIGCTPENRAISGYFGGGIQIRNGDGSRHVEVTDSTVVIQAESVTITVANDNVEIESPVTRISGDVIVGGDVIVNGDTIASGVSLVNHIHTGDSGGSTSPPR